LSTINYSAEKQVFGIKSQNLAREWVFQIPTILAFALFQKPTTQQKKKKKTRTKKIRGDTIFDSSTQTLHQEHHDSHSPATASQHH